MYTLLTVYSAKGLEYDTVFVTGLEERMFPMIRQDDDDDLEEERRLFYVAVTRAKRMLYITYTNERLVFGNHEARSKSRFIEEIPTECFEEATPQAVADEKVDAQKKLKSDKLTTGDKVMHKAWGAGTIVQLTGEGDDQKAVIAFESKGIKSVMLSYAPIEKI